MTDSIPVVRIATLPAGEHQVVSGRAHLERIIRTQRSETCKVEIIPVASWDEVADLHARYDGAN